MLPLPCVCATSCSSLTQQHGDRKLGQSCPLWGADTGAGPGRGLGDVARESRRWEGLGESALDRNAGTVGGAKADRDGRWEGLWEEPVEGGKEAD